jgi:hypothetical protein
VERIRRRSLDFQPCVAQHHPCTQLPVKDFEWPQAVDSSPPLLSLLKKLKSHSRGRARTSCSLGHLCSQLHGCEGGFNGIGRSNRLPVTCWKVKKGRQRIPDCFGRSAYLRSFKYRCDPMLGGEWTWTAGPWLYCQL